MTIVLRPGARHTAMLVSALSTLAVGAPASAQSEGGTVDLMQITVQIPAGATEDQKVAQREAFSAVTRGITACSQVEAVGHQVHGDVVGQTRLLLKNVPMPLRDQLAGKPAGTVTRVFGESDGVYRVIIRC